MSYICQYKDVIIIRKILFVSLRTLLLIQDRLREEHSLQDVLFKNVMKGAPTALPPRSEHMTPV